MQPSGTIPFNLLLFFGIALFSLFTALAVGGYLVYAARFSPRARLKRRIGAVIGEGVVAGQGHEKSAANPRRRLIQAKLKELEKSQKKSTRRSEIRHLIQQAGIRLTMGQFYTLSVISALVAAVGYLAAGFAPIGAVLVAIPAGLLLPKWFLKHLGKRRRKAFTKLFADAVDVIVRGIQSGLPIGECLAIIGRESPEPVGTEFRLIVEGQRLGLTLDDALMRALDRMPTPELKFFSIVLGIQQQTGGNLAETLGNLSRVLRDRKKMADKVRAMSSEARSTAAIIGSLPFVMIGLLFLTSPEYIIWLFIDPMGHWMIGAGITLMLIGILIMKKMIDFQM